MITEKRLEEALKYISDTDEEQAKLAAGLDYLKDKAKREKALHVLNNNEDTSITMKEQRYYASGSYNTHIQEKQALAEKVNELDNKRDKENLIIDVWRTLEASRSNSKI